MRAHAIARRLWLAALCAAALVIGLGPAPAQAAVSDPLFVFTAPKTGEIGVVPPGKGFDGPCGLAVDNAGNFYVSDYYHDTVDVFSPAHLYRTQLSAVDPLDGPCGLALDSAGRLYVNDFHRSVVRYTPSSYPPDLSTTYGSALAIDSAHPTGVAVDPATNDAYIVDRTYVAVYESSGAPLEEAGQPVRIGVGTLGDGYGVAFVNGRLYVADAASDVVKVYDPAVDKVNPVLTVTGPPAGFRSLADSALAVDRVTGEIYVADAVGSQFTEHHETTVDVFDSAGTYKGHLKYNVVNGSPVGLAVDNSATGTQGRVYVTSGNTVGARIYAYGPGAATMSASQPAAFSLGVTTSGAGAGSVTSEEGGAECSDACTVEALAGQDLTLAATPDPGSTFAGWTGADCSGSGPCVVTMDEAGTVDAAFEALSSSLAAPVAPAAGIPATAGGTVASKLRAKKRGGAKCHHRAKRHRHHKRRTH